MRKGQPDGQYTRKRPVAADGAVAYTARARLNSEDSPLWFPPGDRDRALVRALARLLLAELERRPLVEDGHGQGVQSHATGAATTAQEPKP